jgi:hypothetical protein
MHDVSLRRDIPMCREIYHRFKASQQETPDIHTRLMKKYDDIPAWWFYSLMALSVTVSLLLCTVLKREVQLPWWGLIFACGMAFIFTLPISIITATTNQASNRLACSDVFDASGIVLHCDHLCK